jgi:hypothetical protein
MLVIYRMCDIKSPLSAKPPVYEDDITALNILCLNSFIMAFTDVKPKVIFICDFCPKEVYDPILANVPFEHEVLYSEDGINATMLRAYEIALKESDDVILFQECDYLFLPQSGKKIEEGIKHFGLLSPYDHKNFYLDPSIHSSKTDIELFEDHHFRTTERNTMTFGMTREVFLKNLEILNRYGYLDNDVWKEIRVNGNKLWTPLPSFATHMVKDYLSPGIDWEQLWTILTKK